MQVMYISFYAKCCQASSTDYLPGFENFILGKNWSHDPLFLVTSFSSVLDLSSEFSTGHVLHLFKLKFFVVTSCVLLSEEKYQKIKRKSQRIQKTTIARK
jgi:hypothetical protein